MMKTEDENKVLKDGQMIRPGMMMMDSVSKEVADAVAAANAAKPFVVADHMPRHATVTDAQRADAVSRQQAYEKRLTDAWKNPPAKAPAPSAALPAIQTAPLAPVVSADELQRKREALQQKHDQRLADAWREPKGAA